MEKQFPVEIAIEISSPCKEQIGILSDILKLNYCEVARYIFTQTLKYAISNDIITTNSDLTDTDYNIKHLSRRNL